MSSVITLFCERSTKRKEYPLSYRSVLFQNPCKASLLTLLEENPQNKTILKSTALYPQQVMMDANFTARKVGSWNITANYSSNLH
jgi:hypothetical protein